MYKIGRMGVGSKIRSLGQTPRFKESCLDITGHVTAAPDSLPVLAAHRLVRKLS